MAAILRTAFACAALLFPVAAHAAVAGEPGGGDAGGTALVTVRENAAPGGTLRIAPPTVLQTLTVDPTETRPGGTVDLRTFADCGGVATGQVSSPVFVAPVGLALAADGGLYAEARIAADAAPGTYLVREVCSGRPVAAGQVTVARLGAPATGGGWGASGKSRLRDMPRTSSAASWSSSTTSADVAASASGTGMGTIGDGTVGILLTAGAVYSVVVLRRRVTSADA